MGRQQPRGGEERFSAYLDELASVMGRVSRVGPMRDYCTGLLLPGERKSVEPIAAVTAPARVAAQHQSLLHFVAQGNWSDDAVLGKVREMVLPAIERHGAIEAWVIDDTGFPKHGKHSVGVSHQYCGQTGKQDNCQVAVSLSLANHHASLPVAYRLYLPKSWAEDEKRRAKAFVEQLSRLDHTPQAARSRAGGGAQVRRGIRVGPHHRRHHGNAHGARAAAGYVQERRSRRGVPERLQRQRRHGGGAADQRRCRHLGRVESRQHHRRVPLEPRDDQGLPAQRRGGRAQSADRAAGEPAQAAHHRWRLLDGWRSGSAARALSRWQRNSAPS